MNFGNETVPRCCSFQAATGGAPFGCASLRTLPSSSASSLRDNLLPTGPSPCTLRGWICPPCGSLKALSRSAVHSVISSGARSAESRNLFIISSLSRFLHSLRSVEMTKKVLCRNARRRQRHWDCLRPILSGAILMQTGQTKRRGAAFR